MAFSDLQAPASLPSALMSEKKNKTILVGGEISSKISSPPLRDLPTGDICYTLQKYTAPAGYATVMAKI